MAMKQKESGIKPEFRLADSMQAEGSGVGGIGQNAIINQLEENIKLRETPIAKRMKGLLK